MAKTFSNLNVTRAARAAKLEMAVDLGAIDWCQVAGQIEDFVRKLADEVPAWKFWIPSGLRLAAHGIHLLREIKCGAEPEA